MRKIVITGMAAALALGLTACGGNGDGNSAAAPSSPASSAPSESSTPDGGSSPGAPSTPQGSGGSGAPGGRHTPLAQQGGQQITTKWGPLRYLAPGKYTVGNVVFFTATDTVLYVAGGTCPNGTPTPPDVSKCSVDGLDQWVKASPHNATVRFSGQTATRITETQ
ncbi:hypothetical protein OG979_24605 [Actinomadura citrea]|uniref:hypothetical protein n=1 Tax=Actinomadura TaxID=1988 RepID=UPI002E2C2EA1|nr:hypothetical protein [Actinomadura citrea]